MGKIITQCPSCEGTHLNVVKIECEDCLTKFEGRFEISSLLRLPEEDLQFILDFVRCSGSLKEMATIQKVSYPTLRNRLNNLIQTLDNIELQKESSKEEILSLLEEGKISAKDAAIMLKRL
ncbi:Protein of uncharacterised function(DUF2089) (plasmid) [Legionella adelaidensis]|uniref:Protein of uncharacterized function(DUF2089) n=1 Tax=Legionella adelaidensis TaxID=45056 RepID=A0A0W0R1R6_9GAMM|nr:DUF2089 family protein [Legionella adelaidensis]KTC65028.1 hypothetical protein Lade_1551 [Legionella adelaidensis]VEH85453.1 Protein of uncharacterised function(DUF2089) [Legionella adelaidensis]